MARAVTCSQYALETRSNDWYPIGFIQISAHTESVDPEPWVTTVRESHRTNRKSFTTVLRCLLVTLALPGLLFSAQSTMAASSDFAQRSEYLTARALLQQGQLRNFRRAAERLNDYALRPYLDYYYIRDRLGTLKNNQVTDFLAEHADLPVTPLLRKRWLKHLGKTRQWRVLRDHYVHTSNAEIQCYYLRALYALGEEETALNQTTALWLAPKSQPKACDPLFALWQATPRFTEPVVWERFQAALAENERTLARYLLRFFSGRNQSLAESYYQVHVRPERISRTAQFATDNATVRAVIAHGIERLANRDSASAFKAWQTYQKTHTFDESTQARLHTVTTIAQARQRQTFPARSQPIGDLGPDAIEALSLAAVRAQNWSEAKRWISRLPADLAGKAQWQYWGARALESLNAEQQEIDQGYREVAARRHYYGFLAARRLGLNGTMNGHRGTPPTASAIIQVRRTPGIERSIELFAVNDDLNARREWYQALEGMSDHEKVLSAQLAQQLGMTALAIRTANIAEANNYLQLRFPVAHEPAFRQAAMKTDVDLALLIAIARQESAMQAEARSSANARGLMQLLPSTARLVARRARLGEPSVRDLNDPTTNISLGSYHLAWLLNRYNGQMPLAIAAYNAGERRVDRWIKEAEGLPMDVWIERIPFRETRNYVKNVLAFRHVYGNQLQVITPILDQQDERIAKR